RGPRTGCETFRVRDGRRLGQSGDITRRIRDELIPACPTTKQIISAGVFDPVLGSGGIDGHAANGIADNARRRVGALHPVSPMETSSLGFMGLPKHMSVDGN